MAPEDPLSGNSIIILRKKNNNNKIILLKGSTSLFIIETLSPNISFKYFNQYRTAYSSKNIFLNIDFLRSLLKSQENK